MRFCRAPVGFQFAIAACQQHIITPLHLFFAASAQRERTGRAGRPASCRAVSVPPLRVRQVTVAGNWRQSRPSVVPSPADGGHPASMTSNGSTEPSPSYRHRPMHRACTARVERLRKNALIQAVIVTSNPALSRSTVSRYCVRSTTLKKSLGSITSRRRRCRAGSSLIKSACYAAIRQPLPIRSLH